MASFKDTDLKDRQKNASEARKAMLEKFLAKAEDPVLEQRRVERAAVEEARRIRQAEREAAKKVEAERLAAEAAARALAEAEAKRIAEEEAARKAKEEADSMMTLLADQKAARDARYAARKAASNKRKKRGV
jgi:hypothetical protein